MTADHSMKVKRPLKSTLFKSRAEDIDCLVLIAPTREIDSLYPAYDYVVSGLHDTLY